MANKKRKKAIRSFLKFFKSNKRNLLFASVVFLVLCSAFFIFRSFHSDPKWSGGEKKNYQVLVTIHDEKASDPLEDRRSSMKKGYVIGVYDENHEWSETEKISFLILKMRLNDVQKEKIVAPVEKKTDKKKPEDDGRGEIVLARAYRVDLNKLKFDDPNVLLSGQPYKDKVFDWDIVKANRLK